MEINRFVSSVIVYTIMQVQDYIKYHSHIINHRKIKVNSDVNIFRNLPSVDAYTNLIITNTKNIDKIRLFIGSRLISNYQIDENTSMLFLPDIPRFKLFYDKIEILPVVSDRNKDFEYTLEYNEIFFLRNCTLGLDNIPLIVDKNLTYGGCLTHVQMLFSTEKKEINNLKENFDRKRYKVIRVSDFFEPLIRKYLQYSERSLFERYLAYIIVDYLGFRDNPSLLKSFLV